MSNTIKFGDTNIKSLKLGETDVNAAYLGEDKVWPAEDDINYLCFTAEEDTNIAFNQEGTLTTVPTLQYSTDKTTWNDYTLGTAIPLTAGQSCYWRGDNSSFSESASNYISFESTGKVDGSGNIMSLIDSNAVSTTIPIEYCFTRLFWNCTSLVTPPKLPAITLTNDCYQAMFYQCNYLTSCPELPATTLTNECYDSMFYGCKSLITPPELPATTLATFCYYSMFYNCKSLTSIPKLPATTLSSNCYSHMLNGCSKIKLSTTQTSEYVNEYRIPYTGEGTDASNSMNFMFNLTSGTFTGTPTINTTYYTSNEVIG